MTEEKIGPIRKVLLLSGGVDSAFLLSKSRLRQLGPRRNRTGMLCPVFIGYGQPSEKSEWLAAQALADAMRVPIMRLDVSGIDLGDMGWEVGARIVPARNMWLIALAASCVPAAKGDVPQLGFAPTEDIQIESRLYRASELAELLGISLPSVYYWINQGEIRTTKIGSRYFVPPAEVARLAGNEKSGQSENEVWIGAAPQDHEDYPDCREGFLSAMRAAALLIGVELRWSDASREERVEHLREQNLLSLTHSCYSDVPCGDCPSCLQ